MDLVRLARLFSSPCPLRLSILQHLDPLRARWAGGREGPAWLRSMGLTGPIPAAFSSSLSQLPLSQGSQKNICSLSSDPRQPSPMATQEKEEEESFGTLSDKYSSRRMFRKSTAQLYNLRLREQDEEDDERELEPKSWQGRRNTPYWYFFQCKRLIKEGKVREPLGSAAPGSHIPGSSVFCVRACLTFSVLKVWVLRAILSSVFAQPGLYQVTPPHCSPTSWAPALCIQLPPQHLPYTYPH